MLVGYAPGVYDLFHVGHLNILKRARALCDHLVAGVVSDEMALLAKDRLPVVPLAERAAIVAAIAHVDEVVIESQPDKVEVWRQRPFDLIFKGDDWRHTPKGRQLEHDLGEVNVRVVYLPYTVTTSSTLLRAVLEDAAS